MTTPRQAAIDAPEAMAEEDARTFVALLDDEHPHPPHVTEFYTLRDGDLRTTALPGDDLGTAWAEAEAALPEGWHVHELTRTGGDHDTAWLAVAERVEYRWNGRNSEAASGPTPAAALRALTARLKEAGS